MSRVALHSTHSCCGPCHVHTACLASECTGVSLFGVPCLWVCVASVVGVVCTRMGTHCVLECGSVGWGAWLSALQA